MAKMRLLYKWRKKHINNIHQLCQHLAYLAFAHSSLLLCIIPVSDIPVTEATTCNTSLYISSLFI